MSESASSRDPPQCIEAWRRGHGPAAGAHPHRRRRRQAEPRALGPLGPDRRCRHEEADRRLGREEQGRRAARLPPGVGSKINITMAAEAQARPGTTSTRSTSGPCSNTPTARSGGRCHAAADRQVRQAGSRLRISGGGRQALDGGAGRLGFGAAAALRAHQPAARSSPASTCRPGIPAHAVDARRPARTGPTICSSRSAEACSKGRLSRSASAAARTAPTPTRPGAPRSARSAPTW